MAVYTFPAVSGTTILAFDVLADTLQFPLGSYTADVFAIRADGADTVVQCAIETVRLQGVAFASITGKEFVFADGSTFIRGTAGADSLIGSEGRDKIEGGDGDDSIQGGDGDDGIYGGAGVDSLEGGAGSDFLTGGSPSSTGATTLSGGDGDDLMLATGPAVMTGGAGGDHFGFGGRFDTIVDAASTVARPTMITDFNAAEGDRIRSADALGYVNNEPGPLVWLGVAAPEFTATLGQSMELASAMPPDPRFRGFWTTTDGADTVLFMDRNVNGVVDADDLKILFQGSVTLSSDSFTPDTFGKQRGTIGDDTLSGLDGSDNLYGDTGNDDLRGLGGDDMLQGGFGNDLLAGGDGNDLLIDGYGNDTLVGGSGDDSLRAEDGSVTMTGGDGADVFSLHPVPALGPGLLGAGATTVAAPALITDFDEAEGDVITTGIQGGVEDGPVVWRGAAAPAFTASLGQSLALAGADPADARYREFWTATEQGNTVLFVDLDRDFVVGADDLKIVFEGAVALSAGSFSAGTFARIGTAAADTVDTVPSTDGRDVLIGAGGDDTLEGGGGDDSIMGQQGNDVLDGGAGDDTVLGGAGNDSLDGGGGNDALFGGEGSDTLDGGDGDDWLEAALWQDAEADLARDDGAARNTLRGGNGNDTLNGDAGNDILDGGAGSNRMRGGSGNDVYSVRSSADSVIELAGGGNDQVQVFVNSYRLAAEVESAVIRASWGRLWGNASNNSLTGSSGDDSLKGEGGIDTMAGGLGDDTYYVDGSREKVIESSARGGGTDTVILSVGGYTLGENVENLALAGTAYEGYGNALGNVLRGTGSANVLVGGGGADTMIGGKGDDLYNVDTLADLVVEKAGGGRDVVWSSINYTAGKYIEDLALAGRARTGTGNALDNRIDGNHYGNTLNGLAGADTMRGWSGNDMYHVDDKGDKAVEYYASEGIDTVISSVSFTLGKFVENLTLVGTASLGGKGNALDNVLRGNAGANKLNGAAGADTMDGGEGNDTYYVDDEGDLVLESGSTRGGVDSVFSSVSLALGRDVENLTLTALTALDAFGNSSANVLTGSGRSNLLDGGNGADTLVGNDGNDTLLGGRDADRLVGGHGKDQLTGGSGADRFVFLEPGDSTARLFDVVTDFLRGADRIDFSKFDARPSTSRMDDFRFIGEARFDGDATGQVRADYDAGSGTLMVYASTDADRTAEFALQVDGVRVLSASDFIF